ncbi:hypothetical protein [Nocardioides zeae]|uniref:Uncharacterized protein n=1 Tax=Nocardioides zeae TaxID=1457234 RepID=A0AAJ1X280_9ACTN|nr:hypothetical protein [Nocardioides zeae]MDQ1106328.1 hypothetical protein [Nocardioides zeae]
MSWFGPSSLAGVLVGAYGMVVMVAALGQSVAGPGAVFVGFAIAAAAVLVVACVSPTGWIRHVATGAACGIAGVALLSASVGSWIILF